MNIETAVKKIKPKYTMGPDCPLSSTDFFFQPVSEKLHLPQTTHTL